MHKTLLAFLTCIATGTFATSAFAAPEIPTELTESDDFIPASELLRRDADNTECATNVFARALQRYSANITDATHEIDVQQWIHETFARPDVLTDVMACPEMTDRAPDATIKFMPIEYTFPSGRQISINYETQPRVLSQRITLGQKRDLPQPVSPLIGARDDNAIWTNTDPAWYGILVTQHGALDNFIGPDKNNTISLQYIEDNIDNIYPRGANCTSKTAIASDTNMINMAATRTVGIAESTGEKDTNDYYVAGDKNLQWIGYAEIALDVILTVATYGGWTVVSGATKAVRASKVVKNLGTTLRSLSRIDTVRDYIRLAQKSTQAADAIKALDKIADASKTADRLFQQLNRTTDIARRADILKQLRELDVVGDAAKRTRYLELLNQLETTTDVAARAKIVDDITDLKKIDTAADAARRKSLNQEISEISKTMKNMEKTDDNVKTYKKTADTYTELNAYRRTLRGANIPRRGNIAVRAWRGRKMIKAARTGNDLINKGAKMARAGMKSGRTRDWLFQSTMRNIGKIGRVGSDISIVYALLQLGGDMYDFTETSTGDFTNNIQFKPLGLLSADDIPGQENQVNYGMWLMWHGDSLSPADDDAAYLQAMDFASKFHQDLIETMDEKNSNACNVDIFVVRPIIRNPGAMDASLYYLIMNDVPWTTSDTE